MPVELVLRYLVTKITQHSVFFSSQSKLHICYQLWRTRAGINIRHETIMLTTNCSLNKHKGRSRDISTRRARHMVTLIM